MFPQSELDNYKLQVELLQEKLQRSEISRQQLEHKLDKILQKRDEHDKIMRSKARQKYQQFLEEQQRRNERNKQLVQMLERIEQQTETLNARSERLKMMKLQYEMYFAKLVHTQTRRCIQNSVQPITHIMPSPSTHHVSPIVQQPTMEEHNNVNNIETTTPVMTSPYQWYSITPERKLPINSTDIPTLANFNKRAERNDCKDARNFVPQTASQQLYQHNAKMETVNFSSTPIPANFTNNNNNNYKEDTSNNINSFMKENGNTSNPSVANLYPNDKKLSEPTVNSNLLASSSTFEEIPNLAMIQQKIQTSNQLPKTSNTKNSYNDVTISNDTPNYSTITQYMNSSQSVNEIPTKPIIQKNNAAGFLQNLNANSNNFTTTDQHVRKEIETPVPTELNTNEISMPKQDEKPSTSLQVTTPSLITETSLDSTKNKNNLKKQPISIEQIENESLYNYTETNSSTTPVSIENIENKIYGELLSPYETEEVQKQETSNNVPTFLENLVTQSENMENISSEETQLQKDTTSVTNNTEDNTIKTDNNQEQNPISYNYEQNTIQDDFNNVQQSEESVGNFADYANYENVDGVAIDESQQQQYDYSNYDPTQYSYPGYIYDETTGEYKPDPNAPAEQYATDQQYASEGYEQQYQQQDYDYNQAYTEEPVVSSATTVENPINNDYETAQQDLSSNILANDSNITQQQIETQPEYTPTQTEVTATEEVSTPTTAKTIKPTSILSTADKSDSQKKKKRVNFIDSSETDESAIAADKGASSVTKPVSGNLAESSESDFDFSSSTEAEAKAT